MPRNYPTVATVLSESKNYGVLEVFREHFAYSPFVNEGISQGVEQKYRKVKPTRLAECTSLPE